MLKKEISDMGLINDERLIDPGDLYHLYEKPL